MRPDKSEYEDRLAFQLKAAGLVPFEREYRFHHTRKWRADFAYPDKRILIEIEGGIWIGGRHNHPTGYLKDLEKYNAAQLDGWMLLRFTTGQVNSGAALDLIEKAIGAIE